MARFLTFLLLRGLCHFILAGCGPFCVSLLLFQPHLTDSGPLSTQSLVGTAVSFQPTPAEQGPALLLDAASAGLCRGSITSLSLLLSLSLQPRMQFAAFATKAQVGGSCSAWSRSQTPRSFSCQAALQLSQLVLVPGFFLPKFRTLHFPFLNSHR